MRKGFTLIELLVVIVILAVLALIATPIVLNIIDDSKKNATLRSSENYIKAIEFSIAKSVMENKRLSDGTYQVMTNGSICLGTLSGSTCSDELVVEVSGETPESGTVTIKSRKIDSYEFTYKSGFVVVNGEIQEEDSELNNLPALAKAIVTKAKDNNYYHTTTPDFSKATQEGEYGLYQAPDDYGTSYYFRGDTEDNYVQFIKLTWEIFLVPSSELDGLTADELAFDVRDYSGFTTIPTGEKYDSKQSCLSTINYYTNKVGDAYKICQPTNDNELDFMYWRIVRITGEGSLRLVYDGLEKKHNGELRENISFYDCYSVQNDQGPLDEFFKRIQSERSNLIELNFCDDRQVIENSNGMVSIFATYKRFNENKPQLTCNREEDKVSVNSLTFDELMMAGASKEQPNLSYYLYTGNLFSTIGLLKYDNNTNFTVAGVDNTGSLLTISYEIDDGLCVDNLRRPVINLKADVKFTGDGSYDNPYVIITE